MQGHQHVDSKYNLRNKFDGKYNSRITITQLKAQTIKSSQNNFRCTKNRK